MSLRRTVLATLLAAVLTTALTACEPAASQPLTEAHRAAIADTITRLMDSATVLTAGDAVARMMSLYPASGPVVSASAGRMTTSRDSLEANIRSFWQNVGRNMREPRWTWQTRRIDVLSPDAAAFTGTYAIPHRTPRGAPHVVGGAWTAVFTRRDGRWVIIQEHLSDRPPGP